MNAIESGAPQAFSMTFDTLAYNSCFGASLASRASHFTFRAGAYESGGVRVNKSFLDYAKAKIKPSYPNPTITSGQVKELLAGSAANKEAQIQFSIRQTSNMKGAEGIYRAGATPAVGIDFFNLLGPLTDERWSDTLLAGQVNLTNEPDFLRYFVMGPRGYRNLEVSQAWNASESLAQSIREKFRTDAVMALTFQDPNGAVGQAMGPGASDKVYGTGYQLNFGIEMPLFRQACRPVIQTVSTEPNFGQYIGCSPAPYTAAPPDGQNPDNILASVQEIDLSTGTPTASSWTCPQQMRLIVVRPSDQEKLCPKGEDFLNLVAPNAVAAPTATQSARLAGYYRELEQIRRVLPADQWDVSLSRRCVVPKESDCYSQEKLNNKLVRVQYDPAQKCFQGLPDINYAIAPQEICAQFVSICTRGP